MFNERRAANRNEKVPQQFPQGPNQKPSYDERQRDTKLNRNQPPRYPQAYVQQHQQQQQHENRPQIPSQPRGYGNQNYHGYQGQQGQQGSYNQRNQASYQQRRPRENGPYSNDEPRPKRQHSDRGRQHNYHQHGQQQYQNQRQHQQSYQRRTEVKVQPLMSFKPKDTKWDITHPRLVGFLAKFVKTNGVFPTPGSVSVDSLTDEAIAELKEKQKKLEEERINSMGSQKLPSPLAAKVSRTVIFKGYDIEKHTLQAFHKYLENFLASTVIPNVSYEDLEITSRAEEDRVVVECVKSIVATTLISFNMKRIDKFDCVVLVKRPFEYIQLVKDLADTKEEVKEEGGDDDDEEDDDDDDDDDGDEDDDDDGDEQNDDCAGDQDDHANDIKDKADTQNVENDGEKEESISEKVRENLNTTTEQKSEEKPATNNSDNQAVETDDNRKESDEVSNEETKEQKTVTDDVAVAGENIVEDKQGEVESEESKEAEPADSSVRILDEIVETASLVCVNNLDPELGNHEITEILTKYGTLHSLAVLIDKITYDSNGVGFFQFKKLKDPTKKLTDVLAEISANEKWKCFLACENPKNDYYQNVELTVDNVKEYVDIKSQDISRRCMSNTIQLLNLVSLAELSDSSILDMVENELRTELAKLNGFEKMYFVRPGINFKAQSDEINPEFGRVYAKFSSSKQARACLNKICGKFFRGRLVLGSYIDEADYSNYFV